VRPQPRYWLPVLPLGCRLRARVEPFGLRSTGRSRSGAQRPPRPSGDHRQTDGRSGHAARSSPPRILSYITMHVGDVYVEAAVDRALKSLFATRTILDVRSTGTAPRWTVNVRRESDHHTRSRSRATARSRRRPREEVQLKSAYGSSRAPKVDPIFSALSNCIAATASSPPASTRRSSRSQNRVDLIYSINEGPTTASARIQFRRQQGFDDDTLREQIATESIDLVAHFVDQRQFDPDRLLFDRKQLRRFYVSHGYDVRRRRVA